MSAHIACILAPDLPIQLERQRRQTQLPLLITHPLDSSIIFAASSDAVEAGVTVGQMLYQARQMAPHALVIEPDEAAYHAAQASIFSALQDYSPAIETISLGELLVDMRAFVRDEEGDDGLARTLLTAATAASGLIIQIGLANGRFVAQQAARRAPAGGAIVVPADGEAGFLAGLPLADLPGLTGEMRRRLTMLDFFTLGDLAGLTKAGAMRQFGGKISAAYELARGHDPRLLNPDVSPLRIVRSKRLSSPSESREALRHILKRLVRDISATLETDGYDTEGLRLRLSIERGESVEAGQMAKPPTSDPEPLGRLAETLLDGLHVTGPVTEIALSVYPLRSWRLNAHQVALVDAGLNEKLARLEAAIQALIHKYHEKIIHLALFLGPPRPISIRVVLSPDGLPARLDYAGQVRVVIRLDERWREEPNQWFSSVRRDYFRLRLADDSQRVVFQDLTTGAWHLDRERRFIL